MITIDPAALNRKDLRLLSHEKIHSLIMNISEKDSILHDRFSSKLKKWIKGMEAGIFLSLPEGDIPALGWWAARGERAFLWISVDPCWRNRGLGSVVLEKLSSDIRSSGSFKEVRAALWNTSGESADFFMRRGFSRLYTEIEMIKKISSSSPQPSTLTAVPFTRNSAEVFYGIYRDAFSSRTSALLSFEEWGSLWCPEEDPSFLPDLSLLFYIDGLPAAYCISFAGEGSALELGQLGVAASLQGRGYGEELIEVLSSIGASRGYSYLSLRVSKDNTGAMSLYSRSGFTPVSTLTMMKRDRL